ncbi:MAG: phage tail sheath family protein [Lachnospiraceae bacterium]|nr:phage tail sheath family protein [Lachnospiraceae bacterium]
MKEYYHGVRVKEEGSDTASPVVGTAGLQVILGTAPINLVENPALAVNTPVSCQTFQEAQEKLGYSDDFESYTLCQSMYACFKAFAVAPVVFINVLDPAKHKKENTAKEYAVINGQVFPEENGILKKSVVIQNGEETLAEDTDYLLAFDSKGMLVITMISEKAAALTTVKVSSDSIAPELVTADDIIGGYDAATGKETGLEVIRQVYPRTGMAPGLLLAPGWSHNPDVAAVMITKCEGINGVFMAECVLDLDTAVVRKYTDVESYKEENGYTDPHAIVVWPKTMAESLQIYYSAIYGAMTAYRDAENDDVPNISPSNLLARVTAAVLEDGTEVFMDRQQASMLNGIGVVTLLYEAGWRAWGNNTSAYPATKELKDRWICCRRMFSWVANSLIVTYQEKVDSPANYRLIESICDSENIRLNSYVSAGKLAGGRIEYNEEENSVENVLNGQVIFHIYIAVFTPAEDIVFVLKFDPSLLEESLTGTGGAS